MTSKTTVRSILLFAALSTAPAWADDDTVEAAIGGGIGGAVGAAVGSELGGRNGAIVGAGIGAAAGAAVATHDDNDKNGRAMREPPSEVQVVYVYPDHYRPDFCPPGQAKKGRC